MTSATLATAGVSIKLSALSCDDKSDSTSASRALSSPQTSLTKLRRSPGFFRKAESKTPLTFCHLSSAIPISPKSKVSTQFETVTGLRPSDCLRPSDSLPRQFTVQPSLRHSPFALDG